jgi:hypothetical protein
MTADMGTLNEVLDVVGRFLRASGYLFNGSVTVVEEGLDPGSIGAGGTD